MPGVTVSGEVEFIEKGTEQAPERILSGKPDRDIATLKLRISTPTGPQVQVLFRGDIPGHVDVGDQIRAKGVMVGGLLRAESIYNETTASWVTESRCFIASAVAGHDSTEVLTLRRFRDEHLALSAVGRILIRAYERWSPAIASAVTRSPAARAGVLWLIIKPAACATKRLQSVTAAPRQ
jgi:hypothetical protein